jgi:tRNA1Val (adenine37-N6)-methyltransferase
MSNSYFQFKQFTVHQDQCAMKVTTDACLFGAWCAEEIRNDKINLESKTALDIGTGTGLLSLMVTQKNNLAIDAIEVDKAAAKQAMQNVNASPWKEQINVHQLDALQFNYQQQYDFIISNPPFYENEIPAATDKKNLAHHNKGLLLSDLTALIKNQLKSEGTFYLLLPYKRTKEIEKEFLRKALFIHKKCIVSSSPAHLPSRLMIKGSMSSFTMEEKKVSINDNTNKYSPEFISLLKEYYLHL